MRNGYTEVHLSRALWGEGLRIWYEAIMSIERIKAVVKKAIIFAVFDATSMSVFLPV